MENLVFAQKLDQSNHEGVEKTILFMYRVNKVLPLL